MKEALPAAGDIASHRVLHLVPPNGGGVDRFVRDLCSHRPADWLLHVSDEQCVIECPAQATFVPVASADLGGLVAKGALGRPVALHAHSTVRTVREATRLLARSLEMPWILTLHDVQSAGRDDTVEADELAQRLDFIRAAAHRTVPGGFMRDVAASVLGAAVTCQVIENGVDALPIAGGAVGTRGNFPLAVVGAMGRHKGLGHLIDVARELPADMPIVLLGYADGQLGAGWLVPDRIWVHGVFEPAQLPQLAAEYGASLAFFPKGQPESYCYALSDAWLAGLSVVGPKQGAIGERLAASGGGVLYEVDASPAEVARIIAAQLQSAGPAAAGVSAAVRGLTSVAAMVNTMNELYAGVAVPEAAPDLQALKSAAATHLDSRFFRQELLRLQGDSAAATQQRDSALEELRMLAASFEQRGAWIEHMQQGHDSLQKSCDDLFSQLHRQAHEHAQQVKALRDDIALAYEERVQLQARLEQLLTAHAQLQEAHQALWTQHATLVRRLTWPLRMLPASWQKWIKKTVRRVLVGGENNG